jgi:hypothetical protein
MYAHHQIMPQHTLSPRPQLTDSAVSPEELDEYTSIIDGILASADLNTVTRKKVREGLETALGKDLSHQKVCRPCRPSISPRERLAGRSNPHI